MTTSTFKVISDIHGCDEEFVELLRLSNYNPDREKLILLGDYVDRGPDSRGVVERVMGFVREYGAVALGGNHEELFLEWLAAGERSAFYLREVVGGRETIDSYCKPYGVSGYEREARQLIQEKYAEQVEFMDKLLDFHEEEGYIFVHAGIDPKQADWKQTDKSSFRWIRDEFHFTPHQASGVVVFGHTPTTRLHGNESCGDVWFGEKIIGVDGGCVFGNQLNCLEISPDGLKTYVVPRMGM
ncbi:serine/threonine protein phosphatase [Tumebacillus sp. ITR2]|uniref:Serine/threonine protein phosphatase n=1 Tax=Tumebacillus amylolyticus TaxID=2801339 RepID=A0ABS1JDZ7_9BACL|nr:metallophosphoesterase family protein [Tumebacillus amylolyticus]MBL0388469.1 serine/threonine protein phosphatase [Tumebacillus amylolyticus]